MGCLTGYVLLEKKFRPSRHHSITGFLHLTRNQGHRQIYMLRISWEDLYWTELTFIFSLYLYMHAYNIYCNNRTYCSEWRLNGQNVADTNRFLYKFKKRMMKAAEWNNPSAAHQRKSNRMYSKQSFFERAGHWIWIWNGWIVL